MAKGWLMFLILLFLLPLAYSISIKNLLARYSFSTVTTSMNVTNHIDFMIDKNGNGINDTLVFELTTNNTNGTFIFIINLFDKGGILTNETNKTLGAGANKLNISFNSYFLSQNQFNYTIKVYNKTFRLKYREDNILSQRYANYEEGFKVISVKDLKDGKVLKINVTINASLNNTYESALFLTYNNSVISAKRNITLTNSIQDFFFNFDNETIKRTHNVGSFNVSSIKIDKKIIKTNFTTLAYDFKDFAATSYIFNFTDNGTDINGNSKYDFLQINVSTQALANNNYTILLALYDLFEHIVEIKNTSLALNQGKNVVSININGTRIYDKKLNGPFIVKNIELYEKDILVDKINDAYITSNYNFNDFDNPNLPDLKVNISVSDGYRYGIDNITINFTFKNIGNKKAFNVFTEILDNRTFSKANKTNVNANSQLVQQFVFTNFSDFEISAFVDLQDFVEELNESNNAERIVIKLNKKPSLVSISNITVNETDRILLNISASDPNNDALSYSINWTKFSNTSNIFIWDTSTIDSGNYTLNATASDGYLSDSFVFKVIVLDVPELDVDNDGINDSIDRLIGDETFVNTSTFNLTIFIGNSRNLSKLFNESMKIRLMDSNLTIAEFDFNFLSHKLNLTNLTIDKQLLNSTGSLLVRGLKMPIGATKALYIDRVNPSINGVCIKDTEISSISDISSNCGSSNEFKVECDGTLQGSYSCTFNSSLNKYKVQGLRHSGVVQFAYTRPSTESESSSTSTVSGSGGGGGLVCISSWQCDEWTQCLDGFRNRKCIDINQCAFPTNKPLEIEECSTESKLVNVIKPFDYVDKLIKRVKQKIKPISSTTGQVVKSLNQKPNFGIFIVFVEIFIIVGAYLMIKNKISKNV